MAQGTSDASTPAPNVLQVQHQIRTNASELQDYFADLYKWEKAIGQEEAARKQAVPAPRAAVPLPRARQTVSVASTRTPVTKKEAEGLADSGAKKRADAHTYDKGYKKWEKFDADAALRDTDEDDAAVKQAEPPVAVKTASSKPFQGAERKLTNTKSKAASAAPVAPAKSREDIEREDGNEHYKRGDYVAAIKSYTRALGFNSRNVVVLSNRAMAYLKNKECTKAEDDCTLALKLDDAHVKSYARRGTARNALGKHRLAMLDFERALALDPKSKQAAYQVAVTKELIRTAIKRAPTRTQFSIKVVGEEPTKREAGESVALSEATEDKENAPYNKANAKITVIAEGAATPLLVSKREPQTGQPRAAASFSPAPATPAPTASRSVAAPPLPKLPKKVPASSYEFLRVWKTLAPKGDATRAKQLLELRASYLRLLDPMSLPSVFKNSIESELCCEMFVTIRQAMDVAGEDGAFVLDFVRQLPRVPRFSMVVMFLSDREKADIAWVLETLATSQDQAPAFVESMQALRVQYGLT